MSSVRSIEERLSRLEEAKDPEIAASRRGEDGSLTDREIGRAMCFILAQARVQPTQENQIAAAKLRLALWKAGFSDNLLARMSGEEAWE